MPFITEELWAHMVEHGVARRSLLALSAWPDAFTGSIGSGSGRRDGLGHPADFGDPVRAERNERSGRCTKVPLVITGGE